jgi:hypothetical protein
VQLLYKYASNSDEDEHFLFIGSREQYWVIAGPRSLQSNIDRQRKEDRWFSWWCCVVPAIHEVNKTFRSSMYYRLTTTLSSPILKSSCKTFATSHMKTWQRIWLVGWRRICALRAIRNQRKWY